jgi:hypothetical protein
VQPFHFTLTERRTAPTISLVQPFVPDVASIAVSGYAELYSVIARIGHDRAVSFGLFTGADIGWHLPQIYRDGTSSSLAIAYPADQNTTLTTSQARGAAILCTRVQMTSCPPDSDTAQGVTWIASGTLGRCDGQTIKTAHYHAAPSVAVYQATATARGWAANTYSVIAIYETSDAAGNVYRSAPSTPVSFTTTGVEEPRFAVTWPLDASAEQYPNTRPKIKLFISTGGSYYPLDDGSEMWVDHWSVAGWGAEFRSDNGTSIYTANTSGAPCYTSGAADEELASEPPPALLSIAGVGDRLWGIDAEDRTRLWFTKPFSSGIAPEWNTACTVTVADELVAVRDVAGVPTAFGKSGIWQIFGEGPNALGSGTFAPPRRLPHNVVVSQPQDVCRALAGAAVAARGGLFFFDGQTLENFGWPLDSTFTDTKEQSSVLLGNFVAFDHAANEIRVFSDTAKVFNLDAKKWSSWNLTEATVLPFCATNELGVMMLAVAGATPTAWKVYETPLGTHKALVKTPHIKLDGLTGFGKLWEVWLAIRNGQSGNGYRSTLTVTLTYDYGDSTSTHSISNTSLDFTSKQLVMARVFPTKQRVRAIQIQVEETTPFENAAGSYGLVPVSARLVYGADRGRNKGRIAAVG